MRIHALTVCVNYADHFQLSLPRWKAGMDSMLVITSPDDADTIKLCRNHEVQYHTTNVFTEKGAHFNQGAALNEGYQIKANDLSDGDWVLLCDADVIPPTDIRTRIEMCEPVVGHLYGSNRHYEDGRRVNDPYPAGFFLLFNVNDPNAKVRPIIETCWAHCGNWDSRLISRWERQQLHFMPIPLRHIGEPFVNWCGRGNHKAMNDVLAERRRRRDWRHEKIQE